MVKIAFPEPSLRVEKAPLGGAIMSIGCRSYTHYRKCESRRLKVGVMDRKSDHSDIYLGKVK